MTKEQSIENVQPLRTAEEIEEMKFAIRRGDKGAPKRLELADRDVLLFLLGINTGLRIGDIVKFKVGDVKDKNLLTIREGKNKKKREINISMLQMEVANYTVNKRSEEYLFKSQKGNHITTTQAYRILASAGNYLGRNDIGTHTMRKTFGYHYYRATKDIATLQEIFNHSHPKITKVYIGIRQDEINESLNGFRLG